MLQSRPSKLFAGVLDYGFVKQSNYLRWPTMVQNDFTFVALKKLAVALFCVPYIIVQVDWSSLRLNPELKQITIYYLK